MRREIAGSLFVICLLCATLVHADNTQHEVVTNPSTALSATMSSALDTTTSCVVWTASGKVSPKYRSEGGTSVKLVCTPFCVLNGTCTPSTAPILSFPDCNVDIAGSQASSCSATVDSCGNFSFEVALVCPPAPQALDPSYSCVFVVHTDISKGAPQSCSGANSNQPPPQDPNGSAPCSGGYCPIAP